MPALLVFAVALAVRLIHVWQIQPSPFFDVLMGDAKGYDQWAARLAAGDWIGRDVFYQAPGYPYFLGVLYAVFGRDLLVVRIAQAVIGSASCALLAMAGTRLFTPSIGAVAGLGLALWGPAIFFDGLLQKSVLDMFFVCLGLWLVSRIVSGDTRRGSWIALGAAMGGLALTRENALVWIAVILIWAIRRATVKAEVLPFIAGLVLVLSPVVARNYAVDGGFYLTTSQFGPNFYIGNNAGADGTYASIRFGRGSPEFERIDATEVAEASSGRKLSPAEVSSFWTRRALAFITAEPLAWLQLTGRKVLLLFNRTEMLDTEAQESYAAWSAPVRLAGWYSHFGILVPLAVLGLIITWPYRDRLWIVHAMALTYAASVVMFFVFARYRYPLVPFLLLFAAAALVWTKPVWASITRPRRLAAAAVVTGVTIFANWPVLSPTLMIAITENNLGTALQERKRYDEAIPHYQRAIALMPDYAPAHNNLGVALRAAGRRDEAVASYRKALELKPDYANARYNLANALLEQGKAGASADTFRQALAAAPRSVEAQNNLGIALAQKGDVAGAIEAFRAALAIDNRSVNAHRNLGNMLIDSGRRAEGLALLERAVQLAPAEPDATYDIGTVFLQDGNFPAAQARFEAAVKLRPDWAEAHNNLGIALASQGRLAQAVTHFERAVAINPGFTDARANMDQARLALRK